MDTYDLKATLLPKSKAKLFGIPINIFVMGEKFEFSVLLENNDEKDFPGGKKGNLRISFTSDQRMLIDVEIEPLPSGSSTTIGPLTGEALSDGYALFYLDIGHIGGVTKHKIQVPPGGSFGSIFTHRKLEIYSFCALMVSVVSLFLIGLSYLINAITYFVNTNTLTTIGQFVKNLGGDQVIKIEIVKEVAAFARTVIGATLIILYALLIAHFKYPKKVALKKDMLLAAGVCLTALCVWLLMLWFIIRYA